jgi:endonuclease VIII
VEHQSDLRELGPDPLAAAFDEADAVARIAQRGEVEIADALLDQRAVAGIGNIFKSETLFMCRVNPFTLVRDLDAATVARLVTVAAKLLRLNVKDASGSGIVTTGRADPSARLWVYGRGGKPCRRCGTPISRQKQGANARSTYWCERCQPGGVRSQPEGQNRNLR